MKETLIGTSGYNYQHWAGGVFYPKGLPQNKWLEFYCQHFNTVELNVTFYRLPAQAAFKGWDRKTSADFKFVIKGNRFITHIKKLKDCRQPLKNFTHNISPLNKKISSILWQLPPNYKKNALALEDFCADLKKARLAPKFHHTFEFRHQTWFDQEIYDILKASNFALCIADPSPAKEREILTADFVYLRFHGQGRSYSSNYSAKELKEWAKKARAWLKKVRALYAFFNNDAHGYAIQNAKKFRTLLK